MRIYDISVKGGLHLLPKIRMFVALFKIINNLIKKNKYASYRKLSKELLNGIKILVGQAVFNNNNNNIYLNHLHITKSNYT